jgi:hypothetical protein
MKIDTTKLEIQPRISKDYVHSWKPMDDHVRWEFLSPVSRKCDWATLFILSVG